MKKIIISVLCLMLTNSISNAYAENLTHTEKFLAKLKIDQKEQASEVSITKDEVKIIALNGTDLFTNTDGTKSKNNTPKAYFEPDGDFIFSTKVSPSFNSPYDGGALYVYVAENKWAKLLFEKFKSGNFGVASTVTKSQGDDAYHNQIETPSVYLKVVRIDTMYVFYSSPTGGQWSYLRSFGFNDNKPAKIGFTAQSPLSEQVPVIFSDINFESRTIEDFWQGK